VTFTAADVLAKYPRGVISHESAAAIHGLDLLDPPGVGYLTLPRNHSRVVLDGWSISRVDLPPVDHVVRDDVRVTSLPRTVMDLARARSVQAAVVAADSALRQRLVSAGRLSLALNAAGGPGSARCREVAGLLDRQSGSALESLMRLLLVGAGLTGFTTQEVICDRAGGFVARVDFCWRAERLVVEADGFAFHSDRVSYRRDRARMNELERLGWRVLRFTYEDIRSHPARVLALINACLDVAAA